MSMTGELYRVSPRRLEELLADPEQIQLELYPDEGEANPDRCCSVEKTWEAIEVVLSRLAEAGRIPWIRPLTQGAETGAVLHYGAVWYRTPQEVQEIADALSEITQAQFKQGYLNETMAEVYVVPSMWGLPEKQENKEENEENFNYVWAWYEMMVKFYREAADEGDAMLVFLA